MVKVSDLIAEFLEVYQIKTVFGIIGSANSHIFDSINKRGYTEIVCCHHEQAAVLAMGAYYRTCGKLSAAIVTAGAGSSNAVTGVVSNWADSIPGIIFSGQEQTKYIKEYKNLRMWGIQGFDSPDMVEKVTKYATTVMNEKDVQSELEWAYQKCLWGRPGPVWLDIPFDVQAKQIDVQKWNNEAISKHKKVLKFNQQSCKTGKENFNYVIKSIEKSKRPLLLAGNGVRLSGVKSEFEKLVNSLKVPVQLTWGAVDLLDNNNPYYFGRSGVTSQRHANFIIQNCDLLIVMGCRLSLLQTGYDINDFAKHAKIIMIDIDRNEWLKYEKKYDKFILSECGHFIENLNEMLEKNPLKSHKTEWIQYCQEQTSKYPLELKCHDNGQYINSYKFVEKIQEYMKDDQIIVTDMGTALLTAFYQLKLKPKQTMFTSLGLGEMGYGLPGAIGAAFADRNRQVLCLNCDGGMMMNLQELQTIVHHNLPIKIVVFNNDGYLMIKHTQKLLFKGHYTCVDKTTGVTCPNFYKLGNAFGFKSFSLKDWSSCDEILNEFMNCEGPAICEAFMSPEQDFLPKVKGVLKQDNTILAAPLEEMTPLLPLNEIEENMISGVNPKSNEIKR
jgi:acetolactate synthase I/II/III large subunit